MPPTKKPCALLRALLCPGAMLLALLLNAQDTSAQEAIEPAPLRIPADVRGLNNAPYRSSPSPANSANQSHPVTPQSNTAAGEQPASFTTPTRDEQGIVPWTKAGRLQVGVQPEDENNAVTNAKVEPKRLLKSNQDKTLALRRSENSDQKAKPRGSASGLGTMFASLFLVLGLFFLTIWMLKRGLPKGARVLPSEVVEVLGRAPLAGKQQVHLLRVGNKILLIALSPGGAETLTEITDPMEVDRLAGLCQQQSPHSSTNAFKQIFQQFGRRGEADVPEDLPPVRGILGKREVQHG